MSTQLRQLSTDLIPWVIGLMMAIDYFDNVIVTFFAGYIAGGVNASIEELVWVASAYSLGAVLGILHQHTWIERLGYRRYLAICMFAFAASGVMATICDNSMQLAVARGVQGYFIGPMLSACRILIQSHTPPKQRPAALRIFLGMIIFGGAVAPIIGAFLTSHFGWRSLFACTVPASLLVAVLVLWFFPQAGEVPPDERTAEPHHGAYLGFALGQAALQVVLVRSQFEAFSGSPLLICLTVAGVLCLGWFGYHQWRHPQPMLSLHALRHSGFKVGLVLFVVYYYIVTSFSYLLPRLMEDGLGFGILDTGLVTGVASVASGMLLFVYLRFSSRIKQVRLLIVPGLGLGATIAWWLARMSPQAGVSNLLGPLLLRGLLVLMVVVPISKGTFRSLPSETYAHSYRLKNIARQMAISFGTASVIWIQQHRMVLHEARLSESCGSANPAFTNTLDALTRRFILAGHELTESKAMALGTLHRLLENQAAFLAVLDGFVIIAVIALVAAMFTAWQKEIS